MNGGGPGPPSSPAPGTRGRVVATARRAAVLLASIAGWALAFTAAAPLVLRGPVLRWIAGRAAAPLCGSFHLDGGHLGWTLVPDLLFGRAVTVELDGVRIAAPDGTEVLAAERVSARVDLERHPWRVVIGGAVATHGRWRLAIGGARGGGFLDAFRALPEGAARAACLSATPAATPDRRTPVAAPRRPPAPGAGSLTIQDLRLDGVDVELDFPAWGLALPGVRATGMLAAGAPGSAGLLFEVHDAEAAGGVLRIGGVGRSRTTRARFDDIVIGRVGITADRPTDLVLTVTRARTRGANLTGTAAFESILALPGARPEGQPLPALALDARWENTADALDHLEAGWLPRGATLEGVGLGGLITAHLRGPFQAPCRARSRPKGRARASTSRSKAAARARRPTCGATRIDVTPLLDASSRRLLGAWRGASCARASSSGLHLGDVEASIDAAHLALTRTGPGPAHGDVPHRRPR